MFLKITRLWRFAEGMKLELECFDENSGVEWNDGQMKDSSATRGFRIDLLTSQQYFQKSVQTNKMHKSFFLFVCLSLFASRAEFNHTSNRVLQGLLFLSTKHHPRREKLLALKPTLKCLPWKMCILKTRCKQNWAQTVSSQAVYNCVWLDTGLGTLSVENSGKMCWVPGSRHFCPCRALLQFVADSSLCFQFFVPILNYFIKLEKSF